MAASIRKNLLFVEDEQAIANLYIAAFQGAGFDTVFHSNGTAALETLDTVASEYEKTGTRAIDIMILDILLPDISGMDIMRKARELQAFNKTPIIMLTNFSSTKLKNEIAQMPNTEYLLKIDTTPNKLIDKIVPIIESNS